MAVMAEVKKLVPNKPIKYLVNTHHHFDHSSGVRAYAAEGVTIITHEAEPPVLRTGGVNTWNLSPDRLAKSKKKPVFQAMGDNMVLTDGTRSVELYQIVGNAHHDGFVMAYLRKEKLLIEADAFTPARCAENTRSVFRQPGGQRAPSEYRRRAHSPSAWDDSSLRRVDESDRQRSGGGEKTTAEKAPAEKAPAEKAPAEKARGKPAEKAPAEKALRSSHAVNGQRRECGMGRVSRLFLPCNFPVAGILSCRSGFHYKTGGSLC